jgi:tRNA/rRNA methyltransferase
MSKEDSRDERRGLSPPTGDNPPAATSSEGINPSARQRQPLTDCRIVLVRPHYPGNIGATARIMGNLGADDLVLVEPVADRLDPAARQMSTHSEAILHRARVVGTLAEALADRHLAVATSASAAGLYRQQAGPPEQVLADVAKALAAGKKVTLVFGPEPTGLTNDEIAQCQGLVTIPTAETHPSLNLAQAVAICLYELHKVVTSRSGAAPTSDVPSLAEMERLFTHLRSALEALHFLYGDKADSLMHALRQMLGRANLSVGETKILHGLARQILWNRDNPRGPMQVSPDASLDPPLEPP